MLAVMTNAPRDYDWGSTTLIADLEGRAPSGRPEAEVWFGDHAGCPAHVADGRPLGEWLAAEGVAAGAPPRLPYLMKLLAAASSLSIQAHPSRAQAIAAFAREDAEGIPRDAPDRTYRDENHKPELIVAVSETFTALAGVRDLDDTRRLLALLGEGGRVLADRLSSADAAAAVRDTIQWLLSGDSGDVDPAAVIAQIVAAAAEAESPEFAGELDLIRRLAVDFPGDRGIGVALLMNLVVLRRGEGLFVPAGVLHAYQAGLGVEIMAASDNVLRGGLTPKHVDVGELVSVLDPTPGPVPVLRPGHQDGVARFAPDVPDFALSHIFVEAGETRDIDLDGVAIVLATVGAVSAGGGLSGAVELSPGEAVLITPDEGRVRISGAGELFIAQPGAASATVSAS